ncbi:MAG TPA: 2,3-bisphosphoglycerate-independent phosphoglycerate mutase [Acidimicrobiia bacterium]|nr:2,3-bisphosphoglycerate-independent phosphoglycerate mutase [Acidimicrobiia bacterium]
MKYVALVPDGCADEPLAELGGRTPLEAAAMPNLDRLAARSEVGRATVIPDGLAPGSDVGNMAILGYDPAEYHSGRAPIEAAAMGVPLESDEVAFRCNLVTVADDTLVDFAGGHPTDEQSHPIVAALDAALGDGRDGIRFFPGVEYRHLCVAPRDWGDAQCTPPHDLTGKPVVLPTGPAAGKLRALMDASGPVVRAAATRVECPATQIWLWGQGVLPVLPPFAARFGVEGRLSSAVDLVRGLGVLTGLDVLDVAGATAGYDNDYGAQAAACLASLVDRPFFLLHVEATDEAGHQGDATEKVAALERWDAEIIGPLVDGLAGERHRILLLPDHATPCALRTHTSDPVPYLFFDDAVSAPGGVYTEAAVADRAPVPAPTLMARLTR